MNIEEHEKVLNTLPMRTLRGQYANHYGYTPKTRNRTHLIKKILWAIQRNAQGDISDLARNKALAIADDRDVKERFPKMNPPIQASGNPEGTVNIAYQPESVLLPGSVLHRDYQGETIQVLVLENGFEWNGEVYRSLSATARAITGTRWNGKLFFGLKKGAK
ncbi:hypothetical protein PDESU_04792 [Pontiella desulfatans]|uniref:DUF2924 domain-containing protein n=1 Tax=Pontiella desulfatans TaxID=2750659 RepID=A0A6C2U9L0_PONDE|nr:DUF2924 domain-containing protein [Pontiella desulfatans]VGO16201.1 hypothetical protein PDESU_04792 [Pontiella desulfatans]